MALKIVIDHKITVKAIQAEESQIINLLKELKIINLEHMAKTKQDFDALTERLNASHTAIADSLTNLADDVRRLTEGTTPVGGLTEAEATEIFDSLEQKATQIEGVATQIRALADQTPDAPPVP